jgi:hypothetical protein
MSRNSRRGGGLHRWRAPLIVILVIPAVLCAFAVKSARAAFYKAQPILCDGVDDNTASPMLCALPEETAKESFSKKAGPHAPRKIYCPATSRSRVTPVRTRPMISSPDSPLRFKRELPQRAGSSHNPNSPH